MISPKDKFPLRTDFVRFRSRAQRFVTPHTTYFILHTSRESRLAVVVPKKVSKLATTRNYLKRLTYDAIWPLLANKRVDCVIVYKPILFKKSLTTTKELDRELSQAAGNL